MTMNILAAILATSGSDATHLSIPLLQCAEKSSMQLREDLLLFFFSLVIYLISDWKNHITIGHYIIYFKRKLFYHPI